MKIKKIGILIVFALMAQMLNAQHTLYFMDRLPQYMEFNPAFQMNNNFYFSFPSAYAKAANSGFAFNQIAYKDPLSDTTIVSLNKMAERLAKKNFFLGEAFVGIIGFGLKKDDMFLSFGINNRTQAYVQYPQSLLDIRYGNYNPETQEAMPLDFSNVSFSAMNYTEIVFGASKELSSQLTVGAKAKLLAGSAYGKSKKTDIILTTQLDANKQVESVTADVDIDLRTTSLPYQLFYDEQGIIDSVSIDEDLIKDEYMDYFVFNGSYGLAFDFGATYKLTPKITLAASLLDLGFIRWKEAAKQITSQGSFTFQGLELVPDENGNFNVDSLAELLTDSIISTLSISDSDEPFMASTVPKVIISGSYQVTDRLTVGAMLRADFYGKAPRLSSTFSSSLSFGKRWQVATSYSFMHRSYHNLGLGFTLNLNAFNIFMVTDNIPVRFQVDKSLNMPFPTYINNFNFRIGFNLLLGYKNKIDKPSFETEDILKLE